MKPKVTRTTNELPFSSLEPGRFEDLCLALLYSVRPWSDIRHYGRLGGDLGVDISAWEVLENGVKRTWSVQCRRYAKAAKADLMGAVDDAITRSERPPDVLLVVVPCHVSRTAQDAYDRYAQRKGVAQPILWTRSVLEAKLHAERRDLLFSYFDHPMAAESRAREITLTRNIAIKRRVLAELVQANVKYNEIAETPWARFRHAHALIRSVDDSSYPRVSDSPGISSWFKVDYFDLYHNGIAFILAVQDAALTSREAGYQWALLPSRADDTPEHLERVNVYHLGRVPYRNIVEIDTYGDGYNSGPHIYCQFADGGEPFEDHEYVLADGFPYPLDGERRVPYERLIAKHNAG